MREAIEILPDIQHNSFIVPVKEPYELVNAGERQAYGKYHYECIYDENGSCTVRKKESRVMAGDK